MANLIKKPSELEPKSTISALIYGAPGSGKTTLACSAPAPVMFDFDNGLTRINGAFRVPAVQVTSWEDVLAAIEEVGDDFKSIIIDTVGSMLIFMEDFIKRENPKLVDFKTKQLTLKGYGVRKRMFNDFKNNILHRQKNIIFVAHDVETKQGDEVKLRPLISGSSLNDLMQDIDLVGYLEPIGKDRSISFDSCDRFYGKNTCELPPVMKIKNLIDEKGNLVNSNDFLTVVLKQFFQKQKENLKKTCDYEDILLLIDEKINFIVDADTCNVVVEEVKDMQHIWNSKLIASMKIAAKAKELNLTLKNGVYSDGKQMRKI